jgi:hypothetical protein
MFASLLRDGELRKWQPLSGEVAGNLELAGHRRVGLRQIPGSNARGIPRRNRVGEKRQQRESDTL